MAARSGLPLSRRFLNPAEREQAASAVLRAYRVLRSGVPSPRPLDRLGERLLDARTIGRPDKITSIFGRRVTQELSRQAPYEIENMHLPKPVSGDNGYHRPLTTRVFRSSPWRRIFRIFSRRRTLHRRSCMVQDQELIQRLAEYGKWSAYFIP